MYKTDYRFKFLYVIGIISVIVGHCGNGGISLFYEFFPPYSFQLSLFIFCSGYFYKETSINNVHKFMLHKAKLLIVPLYLWNLFYGVFITILNECGFTLGEKLTWYTLLIAPIKKGGHFKLNIGGWFIIPLFTIQVFNVLVRKFFESIHVRINEWVYFCGSLLLGITGAYLIKYSSIQNWWFILNRILCFIPFYSMGFLYKKKLEQFDKLSNMAYFFIIIIIQLVIITWNGGIVTYNIYAGRVPQNVVLIYVVSYLAIAFWLRISKILLPITTNNKVIDLIGNNTYIITINHFIGFFLISTFFALVHKYTVFCNSFDMSQYKNFIYIYLPQDMKQWYLIYYIAGIATPLIMQLFIDKIKNKFNYIKFSIKTLFF